MKFTIGNQSIEAVPFEPETFTSEKSEKKLRKMKIKFTIFGDDATEQYKALERVAGKRGVISEEPDGTKILWNSSLYLSSYERIDSLRP